MRFIEYQGVCGTLPRTNFEGHALNAIAIAKQNLSKAIAKKTVTKHLLHATQAIEAGAHAEIAWNANGRPYYNMPEARNLMLLDVTDVRLNQITFPSNPMLLRCPESCALVSINDNALLMITEYPLTGDDGSVTTGRDIDSIRTSPEATITDVLDSGSFQRTIVKQYLHMLFTMPLLSHNNFKPEILSKDSNAINDPQKYSEAVDRAKRRGKVGWSIQ